MILKFIFWISLALIFYTYIGYAIILYFMVRIKRLFERKQHATQGYFEPEVTLLIAAYNERDYVNAKMANTQMLNYPIDKLIVLWITDGSNDGTQDLLKNYSGIRVEHLLQRSGKISAINRGMKLVTTPITVFCDANTTLGANSIRYITQLFADPKVGCVSGEKRILLGDKENASAAGEGIYWKYESTLKRWDSELYSVVGAAGELFAIRTELFSEVEPDTLLDDFMISMRIAKAGYTIKYNPEAYAAETASANVKEELKRKIRISAGGIQSIVRLAPLLNIFRYGRLSFQYISHRVLRWTLTPAALLLVFPINLFLVLQSSISFHFMYVWIMIGQCAFYLMAGIGYYFENRKTRVKAFFVPYFFFIMNYAVFRGFVRYISKKQSVNWERAKRA